ncbi:MAG: CHASE2 domain-containing protein [Methylococcaceae bacterium]|nr:CHASE2 domain-containing protein [Methylococcaceae bacterium]
MGPLTMKRYIRHYAAPLVIASAIIAILAFFFSAEIGEIEARVGDKIWQNLAQTKRAEHRIIVVDIDEKSIAKQGAWPWPRTKIAELLNKMTEQGIGLRLIDIVFPTEKEGDEQLSRALQNVPSVMAQIIAIDAEDSLETGTLIAGHESQACGREFPNANTFIANTKNIAEAGSTAGHITPYIDSDGVVRRIPAYVCYNNIAYPALSLSAFSLATGSEPYYELTQNKSGLSAPMALTHPTLTEVTIPLSKKGDIIIPWWLDRTEITAISATDILEGKLKGKTFNGAWAVLGSTAYGVGDAISTPLGKNVDGLEVHVQLLSALLDDTVPYQPQNAHKLQLIWLMIIVLLLFLVAQEKHKSKIYLPPITGVLLATITILIHISALKLFLLWLPWFLPAFFALVLGVLIAISGYAISRKENERLYLNLMSYLPKQSAKIIAQQDPDNSIDAQHKQAIVLYADIRNFSAWCNHLPAEQSGAILHTFYSYATKIIHQAGGEVEEYIGDAILAVWQQGHDSAEILNAAQNLINETDRLFNELKITETLPPLALGVGIESGEILVGSFGPAKRKVYKVLGQTISTTIKLQAMTTELGLDIIIGEQLATTWQEIEKLQSQGLFLLDGHQKASNLFTPVGMPK